MDKYLSVQESMLNVQLEQLGAKLYKIKDSICYINLLINDIKFKYIYHINRKNKYFLERIAPYTMPIAIFDTEEEILDTIKEDIDKFNNARNSNKFQNFINTNKNLVEISKYFEEIFLHYNVSKYNLKDINDEITGIKNKLNEIVNNNEIVYKLNNKK